MLEFTSVLLNQGLLLLCPIKSIVLVNYKQNKAGIVCCLLEQF